MENLLLKKKKIFKIDGIQSTCCVTYNRDSNSIVNNVFPDVDRNKVIPCPVNSDTLCTVVRASNVNTKKYREFQEAEESPDIIERQEAKRKSWREQKQFW